MTQRQWNRAVELAESAHMGQSRRDGEPYIAHPLVVARMLKLGGYSLNLQIAGILHDSVEDSELTLDGLRQDGFDEREVVAVVGILTRRVDKESYEQYGDEIVRCFGASAVKAADMQHNLRSRPKPHKIEQYSWLSARIYGRHGIEYDPLDVTIAETQVQYEYADSVILRSTQETTTQGT